MKVETLGSPVNWTTVLSVGSYCDDDDVVVNGIDLYWC